MIEAGVATFSSLLGEAIKARGLTLERITHRLAEMGYPVSAATLSYWQNGRSQPTRAHSQPVVAALEEILELPTGALTAVAPASQVRRRVSGSSLRQELPRTVEQLLDEVGLSHLDLRKLSTHVTITVDAERHESSEVIRNVVQCLVEGTDRFPVVGSLSSGAGAMDQVVLGTSNCRVGRVVELPEQELVLYEMLLPRALGRGELVMLEYMTSWSPGAQPSDSLVVNLPRVNEMVLEVQFHPAAVPGRVVHLMGEVAESGDMDDPSAVPVVVSDGLAQVVRIDPPAGAHALHWQW